MAKLSAKKPVNKGDLGGCGFAKLLILAMWSSRLAVEKSPVNQRLPQLWGKNGCVFLFPQNDNAETDLPQGIEICERVIYILAKGILFRKRETVKTYEYGTVKQNAGAWRFSMYQRFAADSAYRSSGILPVSLLTFFLGPTG